MRTCDIYGGANAAVRVRSQLPEQLSEPHDPPQRGASSEKLPSNGPQLCAAGRVDLHQRGATRAERPPDRLNARRQDHAAQLGTARRKAVPDAAEKRARRQVKHP